MRQTLFAFLALVITSLLSYNQQQSMVHSTREMVDTEMEVMASGVALQVMEFIGRQAFDDYVTNDQDVTNVAELTDSGSFGQQEADRCDLIAPIDTYTPYQDCDDLDDFHEMPDEQVPFLTKADTIFFDVTATVRYVNDDGSPAASKTFNKEVTVQVRQSGEVQYLQYPLTMTRTFSYERMRRS